MPIYPGVLIPQVNAASCISPNSRILKRRPIYYYFDSLISSVVVGYRFERLTRDFRLFWAIL